MKIFRNGSRSIEFEVLFLKSFFEVQLVLAVSKPIRVFLESNESLMADQTEDEVVYNNIFGPVFIYDPGDELLSVTRDYRSISEKLQDRTNIGLELIKTTQAIQFFVNYQVLGYFYCFGNTLPERFYEYLRIYNSVLFFGVLDWRQDADLYQQELEGFARINFNDFRIPKGDRYYPLSRFGLSSNLLVSNLHTLIFLSFLLLVTVLLRSLQHEFTTDRLEPRRDAGSDEPLDASAVPHSKVLNPPQNLTQN